MPPWSPDILTGFEQRSLSLRPDDEGPVHATLVRRRADRPSRKAVLYVHGYVDYFFQVEMAEQYRAAGFNFYALDLRKYGRSLAPHQTPMYITDIHTYFEELDQAIGIIRGEEENEVVLLNGHSTGGLITSLYAHHRRTHRTIDALFLNSPFFDFYIKDTVKHLASRVASGIGRLRPRTVLPKVERTFYAQSLLRSHKGEWDYDLRLKPIAGFPLHFGWLRAIISGHREVRKGLDIACPILVMSSARSTWPTSWNEEIKRTDVVLDIDHIERDAMCLGNHVTRVRIPGGIHDLMLSAKPVREHVYRELSVWTNAYLGSKGG